MTQTSSHALPQRLDRYTQISELGGTMHVFLRRGIFFIATIVAILTIRLYLQDAPGWLGLFYIGIGACIALKVWQSFGIGLPLLPMVAIQHLAVYGLPLYNRDETTASYAESFLNQAGLEILVFLVSTTIAWRFGMQVFFPSKPYAYALRMFIVDGNSTLRKVGMGLVGGVTGYQILDALQLTEIIFSLLPNGSYSILSAAINSSGMAGYFLLSMWVGTGQTKGGAKLLLWGSFALNGVLLSSGFLLSSTTNYVAAIVLGSFWGSGRLPVKFLTITVALLSFFHVGKFEMRERYWEKEGGGQHIFHLSEIPVHYAEWAESSYRLITTAGNSDSGFQTDELTTTKQKKNQSMIGRVNNLQNLLYAIRSVEVQRIPTLDGATYILIPPLLIPRIFWPEKPRTHEGQIMLNVHFGRQSMLDTFSTYVAWGLVPEAYGNFGAIWGSVILGAALGFLFAWLETATARKPLLSMEGLVTFAVFIGLAVSFEMVASVLITSIFQSVLTIIMACSPFVDRRLVVRPTESPPAAAPA